VNISQLSLSKWKTKWESTEKEFAGAHTI